MAFHRQTLPTVALISLTRLVKAFVTVEKIRTSFLHEVNGVLTWPVDEVGKGSHETRQGGYYDTHAHPSWAVAEVTIVAQENRENHLRDVVTDQRGACLRGKGERERSHSLAPKDSTRKADS